MLMKRMLLLAVLAGIAAGTAGCKQQDAPKLDRQAVRLYVGDQVRITADRPVAWSAADDFYAAVDADGTVTARHVGTTTVTATADSGSAVCTVEVQPRYDTFEEPLYNYLSLHPLSVLKEAETREILEQNDKEIVYKGVAPLEKISYSIVWQDEMPFVLNAVANFFFERYEYDEETNVFHTYHNYQSPPFVSIGFYEMQPEYIIASYNNTYIPGLHTQF